MATAEDRALAEALHRAGKLSAERLQALLAELAARPEVRLLDLLTPEDTGGAGAGPRPPAAPAVAPPRPEAPPPVAAAPEKPEPHPAPVAPPPPPPRSMTEAPPPAKESADSSLRRREKVLRRIGRWDLRREIGRGGLGLVFLATDGVSRKDVAVRILTAAQDGPDRTSRFLRDARAALPLVHPHIAAVLDATEADEETLVAMEYVDGPSLETVLLEQGALPPRTALEIARDAARGLGAGHALGLVHRDVKPGNILLARADAGAPGSIPAIEPGKAWCVKVSDFGLAREAERGAAGAPIGTPVTMSPEAAQGLVSRIDARSDVYSLGCVLYRMLAGVQPYPGNSLQELLPHILASEPPRVDERKPGLHRDVAAIVAMAIARDPRHRYADGTAMADDIDRYMRGEAVLATRPPVTWRLRRTASRHAVAAALALLCVVTLAAAVGWNAWQGTEQARERRRSSEVHLSTAQSALVAGAWDTALREFEAVLSLSPGAPAAVQGKEEALYGRFTAEVRRLVSRGKWEDALSMAESAPPAWRSRPELSAQAALARGTASLEITSEGSWDVDLLVAEPGVAWDEELLPPIQAGRDAGLLRTVGRTPVARFDIPPGDLFVVWSRDGIAARVVPVRLARSVQSRADFRVIRLPVGADVRGALSRTLPGQVLELEAGEWDAGWMLLPGVELRAAPGARATLGTPRGASAITAAEAFGASVQDLELAGGSESAVLVARSDRVIISRCRIRDFDRGGVAVEGGADVLLRDLDFDRVDDQAIRLSGERHVALSCRIRESGWCGIAVEGSDHALLRCDIRGTQRVGIHVRGPGAVSILECRLADCPEWGILVAGAPGSRVLDCTLAACSSPSMPAEGAAVSVTGGCEVRHNTVFGGGHAFDSRDNPRALADCIAAHGKGTGFVLQSAACERFDYNLAWECGAWGALSEAPSATLEELLANPAVIHRGYLAHALQADPRFTDSSSGDFRLHADSPARGAASDGGDLGARYGLIDAAPSDPVAWQKQAQGQGYLERGRERLTARSIAEARRLLLAARALLGSDPEIEELLRRASESP